jgi:hypothetical protein
MGAWIAMSPARRKVSLSVACVAGIAVITLGCPGCGIPLALGIVAYAAIKLSKPHAIMRDRTLSLHQHHRAAVIAAGGALGVAALFSGASSALDLATMLEHRLDDTLKAVSRRGEMKVGQSFETCDLACARAVVLELPTPYTPGIAKLSGFTIHERSIYRWRNSLAGIEASTAQR